MGHYTMSDMGQPYGTMVPWVTTLSTMGDMGQPHDDLSQDANTCYGTTVLCTVGTMGHYTFMTMGDMGQRSFSGCHRDSETVAQQVVRQMTTESRLKRQPGL